MKTQKKVFISIGSQQQENSKENRRTFKELQKDASDKENLVGRSQTSKDTKGLSDFTKKQKLQMLDKGTQTGKDKITAEDLTSDEPSVEYWKTLAETRSKSLNESLQEIEKLKDNICVLKEENRICKEMLEESKNLVEVLQEMLNEQEDEDTQEETTASTDDSK